MPFIPGDRRYRIKKGDEPESVGEMCFKEYYPLIESLKKERRWTTIHNEFKKAFKLEDKKAAKILAWAVFFMWEVQKYEKEKEAENGEIK